MTCTSSVLPASCSNPTIPEFPTLDLKRPGRFYHAYLSAQIYQLEGILNSTATNSDVSRITIQSARSNPGQSSPWLDIKAEPRHTSHESSCGRFFISYRRSTWATCDFSLIHDSNWDGSAPGAWKANFDSTGSRSNTAVEELELFFFGFFYLIPM